MRNWRGSVFWFSVLIYLAVALYVGEKALNYYRHFSDVSITATTEDGHRCLTLFNPEPVMDCYKIEDK